MSPRRGEYVPMPITSNGLQLDCLESTSQLEKNKAIENMRRSYKREEIGKKETHMVSTHIQRLSPC